MPLKGEYNRRKELIVYHLEEAERLITEYNNDNKYNLQLRLDASEIEAEHSKYFSFVTLLKRIKKRIYCDDVGGGR